MSKDSQDTQRHDSLYDVIFHEDRRPIRTAIIIALLFHLALFLMRFPHLVTDIISPTTYRIINIKQLARPAKKEGGPPRKVETRPKTSVPKPKPVFVPVPDLTPDEPEPVYQQEEEPLPDIKGQLSTDLSLGEIYGPPGGGGGGSGPMEGSGGGTGGDGIYTVGAGIIPPEAIVKPDPKFTDDAIRNRISGVVLLYGVVRKNGRIDSLKVIRGLGYGLDEEALNTVATKWKFKPAMKDGKPVDCYVTIEVNFTLY